MGAGKSCLVYSSKVDGSHMYDEAFLSENGRVLVLRCITGAAPKVSTRLMRLSTSVAWMP